MAAKPRPPRSKHPPQNRPRATATATKKTSATVAAIAVAVAVVSVAVNAAKPVASAPAKDVASAVKAALIVPQRVALNVRPEVIEMVSEMASVGIVVNVANARHAKGKSVAKARPSSRWPREMPRA